MPKQSKSKAYEQKLFVGTVFIVLHSHVELTVDAILYGMLLYSISNFKKYSFFVDLSMFIEINNFRYFFGCFIF